MLIAIVYISKTDIYKNQHYYYKETKKDALFIMMATVHEAEL